MSAVIDVGAMTEAVGRLVELQSTPVEGVTDELHDAVHEAITRALAGEAVYSSELPMEPLSEALGGWLQATEYVNGQFHLRKEIQAIFDDSIDKIVTVVE